MIKEIWVFEVTSEKGDRLEFQDCLDLKETKEKQDFMVGQDNQENEDSQEEMVLKVINTITIILNDKALIIEKCINYFKYYSILTS